MAKPPAHFNPAELRQHQIQNQQIRIRFQGGIQTGSPVEGGQHLVSFMRQFKLKEPGNLFFILHNEYPGHSGAPLL